MRRAGDTGAVPSSVLDTGDLAVEGYRRLSIVAGVIGLVALIVVVVWLIESSFADFGRTAPEIGAVVTLLVLSAVIAIGSRRGVFSPGAFPTVAIATEVLAAVALSSAILGWQDRVTPDTVAWLVEGASQPLELGAGEGPWAGLWILFFATLIPLTPRRHLIGALLSILPLAILPFVSVWLLGPAPELADAGVGPTAHVATWLTFRGLLAVVMAYAAARTVHGLRTRLAKARRMGSYQITEKLGAGGMGEVWKAEHQLLARPAAIKLIRPEAGATGWSDVTARFEREVQATAQLRSPHTIEIYDFGLTADGTFYYAMELLDGLDLDVLVREGGPIPWRRAVHILGQACHSLGEAHDRGIVHRDIKPANLFLCRVGRDLDQVKVLDFGLVKARAAAEPSASSGAEAADLTRQGQFIGTPAYAAPEIALGQGTTDPRSDLYALGAVGFWLLTGRRVFEATSPMDMLVRHAKEPAPAPSSVTELEIPAEVDRVVMACLAKDPDDRPASADALAAELAAIADRGEGQWSAEDAAAWWELHRAPPGKKAVI
ncbi:MAG: serine/threonine-protein kinase [Gemmatimonadota bacterium]|nr:serine/threonine-protein kinase [Gemmatimonadota bacterium]